MLLVILSSNSPCMTNSARWTHICKQWWHLCFFNIEPRKSVIHCRSTCLLRPQTYTKQQHRTMNIHYLVLNTKLKKKMRLPLCSDRSENSPPPCCLPPIYIYRRLYVNIDTLFRVYIYIYIKWMYKWCENIFHRGPWTRPCTSMDPYGRSIGKKHVWMKTLPQKSIHRCPQLSIAVHENNTLDFCWTNKFQLSLPLCSDRSEHSSPSPLLVLYLLYIITETPTNEIHNYILYQN